MLFRFFTPVPRAYTFMDSKYLDGLSQSPVAADAAPSERLLFLRKTYSLVLLGITLFAATMLGFGKVALVTDASLWIYTSSRWTSLILMIGGGVVVRMLARKRVVGFTFYLAYAVLLGLLIAPFAAMAGPETVGTAALLTTAIFAGLTVYAFVTKTDFSWLGGALSIGLFAMIGIGVASMIFGWSLGSWYSIAGALLFSGYILYDTSNIVRTNRVDEAVPAAIELFTSVIMLFWHLLSLLSNRD